MDGTGDSRSSAFYCYVVRSFLVEVVIFSMASFNYICLLSLKFNRL